MNYLDVVSAVILNDKNEILICKRKDKLLDSKYEFPGGKKEKNESLASAIKREIKEELNVDKKLDSYIGSVYHEYKKDIDNIDLNIHLHVYLCRITNGNLHLNNHYESKYVEIDELYNYDFAYADTLLFSKIKDEFKIQNIIQDLKELYSNIHSGHDLKHTLRVLYNSLDIAKSIECDLKRVKLIALLHDADDPKIFNTINNDNARYILSKYELLDDSIIEDINDISFKGNGKTIPKTIEGKIVQDADRLDALGAIGIARTFEYGGAHNRMMYDEGTKPREDLSIDEYHNDNQTTINHFYEKLLKLGDLMNFEVSKKIGYKRIEFMKKFLDEFYDEIKES